MKDKLTLALSYYEAPMMLTEHVRLWSLYPTYTTNRLRVLLVDDGSVLYPAEKVLSAAFLKYPCSVSIEVYRIAKDIPQNIWGARNLAFHIASVEKRNWVLCCDIDHILPHQGVQGFDDLTPNLIPSLFYYPSRFQIVAGEQISIGRHLDSFLITPSLYWQTGGYDEDLNGYYYNGAGYRFRRKIQRIARGIEIGRVFTIFYPSSIIPDASPLEKNKRKTYMGDYPDDKVPSVLNFEWERVI